MRLCVAPMRQHAPLCGSFSGCHTWSTVTARGPVGRNVSSIEVDVFNGTELVRTVVLPPGTVLGPGDFWVICGNSSAEPVPNCNQTVPELDLPQGGRLGLVVRDGPPGAPELDRLGVGPGADPANTEGSPAPADPETEPGTGVSRLPDGADSGDGPFSTSPNTKTS